MNLNQKESLKYCLKGNLLQLSARLVLSRVCSLIFLLYCISALYLLVFDTSLIVSIGLYENEYIAAAVCFGSVIIGFLLLLLSVWQNYKYKFIVYDSIESMSVHKFTFDVALKVLSLKTCVNLMRFAVCFICLLPSAALTLLCFKLFNDGVSTAVFTVLAVADFILLINGFIGAVCVVQKYLLCDYCLAENDRLSVRDIIRKSTYLTDGRCVQLAEYKIKRFIFKLLGLIVPTLSVKQTAGEFFIATDKIIPYAQRKAHTEKTIVFYFDKKAAAG